MVSWNMTTVVYWPEIILGNLTNKEDQTIDMLHLNLYGTRLLARLIKQAVFSKLHNNTASRGGPKFAHSQWSFLSNVTASSSQAGDLIMPGT